MTIKIEKEFENQRIDKALATITSKSRMNILKLIEDGNIKINNNPVKASYKVQDGDLVELIEEEPKSLDLEAQDLNLNIVYKDEYVAVINKPKGMVVHPGAGNWDNTLVNGLLYELSDLSGINGVVRPGIVHRIDKDTTGLLMIAKNDLAAESLMEQLKNHECKRT